MNLMSECPEQLLPSSTPYSGEQNLLESRVEDGLSLLLDKTPSAIKRQNIFRAAVSDIISTVREAVRKDHKMDWEWLYDFNTAGDIVGMTAKQLTTFMREEGMYIYHNKYNNYKFVTADQIKQIRGMVLERVRIKGRFSQRNADASTKVSGGSAQEERPIIQ